MTIDKYWLDDDLHNLRWRYIYAVRLGKADCLLLEDPIRTKLGLIGTPTSNALPPGTPSCYKRVVRVQLTDLSNYIDKYTGTHNANR